jgi:hypothetical protein
MIYCLVILNPHFSLNTKGIPEQIRTVLLKKSQKSEFKFKKDIVETLKPKQIREFCKSRDLEERQIETDGEIRAFLLSGDRSVARAQTILEDISKGLEINPEDIAYCSKSIKQGDKDALFFIPEKDLVCLKNITK